MNIWKNLFRWSKNDFKRDANSAALTFVLFFGTGLCRAENVAPKAPDTNVKSASSGAPAPSGSADNFLFTGSFLYSIPIDVVPGLNGMQPQLALQYNSNQSNSWVGMGWDLSLGSIQRSTKNGRPKYDDSDIFTITLKGATSELVYVGTENGNLTYRAKIDDALMKFARTADATQWTVWDKSGTQYFFGSTTDSRVTGAPGVYMWALDKVVDRNGYNMTISYTSDQYQLYPRQILYTGGVGDPSRAVNFTLQDRPDLNQNYRSGILQVTAKRLAQIETYFHSNAGWTNVKTYALTYTMSSRRVRSELTGVQIAGFDGTKSLTLPSTNLKYQATGSGWNVAGMPPLPYPSVLITGGDNLRSIDNGVRFVDFNGDGRVDMLVGKEQSNASHITFVDQLAYLNTPSGWVNVSATWRPPVLFASIYIGNKDTENVGSRSGARMVDVNGDGLPDIVIADKFSRFGNKVWINNGAGWDATLGNAWILPSQIDLAVTPGYPDQGIEILDVNGDGLADIVQGLLSTNSAETKRAWINNGHGWDRNDAWAPPVCLMYSASMTLGVRFVDLNGDGLPDIVDSLKDVSGRSPDISANKIYLNNGAGWVQSTWVAPERLAVMGANWGNARDRGVQFIDVNGDGLLDWVESISNEPCGCVSIHPIPALGSSVLLNTGSGWKLSKDYPISFPFIVLSAADQFNYYSTGVLALDMNDDGQPDLVQSNAKSGVTTSNLWASAARPQFVYEVDNPLGGKTVATYDVTLKQPGTHQIPFPIPILTAIEKQPGIGKKIVTTYEYDQGLYDSVQREFLGFGKVTSKFGVETSVGINPSPPTYESLSKTYYHQNKDAIGAVAPFACFKGRVYKSETYSPAGALLTAQETTWDKSQPFPGYNVYFVRASSTKTTLYDGSSPASAQKNFYYNETVGSPLYGNLVMSASQPGASDERTELIEYASNLTANLLSFPSRSAIKNNAGVLLADTYYRYDGFTVDGAVTSGNVTEVQRFINLPTSDWAVTKTEYADPRFPGYATAVVDANGNRIDTTYNGSGFPATVRNALGHTVTSTYDARTGNVLSDTNINGQVTTYAYDPLGRLIKEIGPLDTDALPSTLYDYHTELLGTPSSQYIEKSVRVQNGQSPVLTTKTYYDGLGRTTKSEMPADGGKVIIAETIFNNRGLAEKTSVPRFNTDARSPLWTETLYDPLGRSVRTTRPDGSFTTTLYQGRITWVTDAIGNTQSSELNAYGRVINRWEPTIAAPTRYQYDLLGNLIQLTDSQGKITSFTYDSLGRKLSMQDPNTGLWTYGYDRNGNLTSQTDARGVTLTLQYDALNRLTSKTLTADPSGQTGQVGGTPLVTYTYDEYDATNRPYSKGKLTTMQDPSGLAGFYHDRLGRVRRQTKQVGHVYTTEFGYDALNRQTQITYPGGAVIKYEYNSGGQLARVTNADATSIYAAYPSYDALGRPLELDQANNTTRTYLTFDPFKQTLATLKTDSWTTGSAQPLRNLAYQFDSVGNAQQIADQVNTANTQNFSYDRLYRLLQAQGGYGTESYTYDALGNLQTKGDMTYTYGDTNHPYAVTETKRSGLLAQDSSTVLTWNLDPTEPIYSIKGGVFLPSAQAANMPIVLNGPFEQSVKTSTDSSTLGQFEIRGLVGGAGSVFNLYVSSAGYKTSPLSYLYQPLTQNQQGLQFLLATDITSLTFSQLRAPRSTLTTGFPSGPTVGAYTFGLMSDVYASRGALTSGATSQWTGYSSLHDSADQHAHPASQWLLPSTSSATGVIGPSFVDGVNEKALAFNGVSDIFVIPSRNLSINTAAFTTMIWVKPTCYPSDGYATLLSKTSSAAVGSATNGFRLVLNTAGKVVSELGEPGGSVLATSGASLPLNQWSFVCATYDGAAWKLYINAQQESSVTYNGEAVPNANPVTLGSSLDNNNRLVGNTFYNGVLDEPRVHNRVWTPAEISKSYFSLSAVGQYAYDANGNMTSKTTPIAAWSYQYDAQGRLAAIKKGATPQTLSNHSQFVYDGDGNRVKKISPEGTTVYIGKLCEVRPDGSIVKHVYADGQLIVDVMQKGSESQLHYYHTDHLGSTSLVTSSSGTMIQSISYKPFGETFEVTGTSFIRNKYTGQEEDAESNLYFYNARYYDPLLGRFASPDSFVQSSMDPQSFNRYAYARNQPTNLVDPSGHFAVFAAFVIKAIIIAAATSASVAAVNGANSSQVWQSAIQGATAGAVTGGFGYFGFGYAVLGSALYGGANAEIQGGDVSLGFAVGGMSAAIGGGFSSAGSAGPMTDILMGAAAGAVGGGVASTMFGGSFRNGAIAGAQMGAVSSGIQGAFQEYARMQQIQKLKAQGRDMDDNIQIGYRDLRGGLGMTGAKHMAIRNADTGETYELMGLGGFKARTDRYASGQDFSKDNRFASGYEWGAVQKGNWQFISDAASTYRANYYVLPTIRNSNDFVRYVGIQGGVQMPQGIWAP